MKDLIKRIKPSKNKGWYKKAKQERERRLLAKLKSAIKA